MRIDLFGNLRAHRDGSSIDRFPTQKAAALLALLAFYPHRRHSREEVVDILWPDADLSAGRDRLSQALVWLRRQLEPKGVVTGAVLFADRASIGLNPSAISTDVAEFESLIAPNPEFTAPLQRKRWENAVSLYQGDLLPGLYHDWVLTERQRLQDSYLQTLHRLVALYEDSGLVEPALQHARLAVKTEPLREEAHADLMRVLAANGDAAAALRQFQVLKQLLAREFETEPSRSSLALVEQIQRASTNRPSRAARQEASHHLPVPLTRFFGRDAEIERICQLLQPENSRLLTLAGTGGAGKTRLSLAVAARMKEPYHGAVAFVALADLGDVKLIPEAIAAALNLSTSAVAAAGSSLVPLVEALSMRPFLLVLDNLEHVLPGAAPLVRELLDGVPSLTVLATSRQRIGIEGEQEILVASLPLPDLTASPEEVLQSASVQLFVDRARLARPDFVLTEANAAAIARVCARLDGIPLAIELCAAWASMLTPAQMLEKLDRRFDLLVSRRTDITPRHRTLRAALEYSYLQLPTELQRLFARLSVFRGGWSLEAAVAVAGESEYPDLLTMLAEVTELRERSLIVAEELSLGDSGPEMRYRILETLREFASEQLTYADRNARRRAHAEYFLRLAKQGDTPVSRLDHEQENLRSVLAWSLESQEIEIGLALGGALRRYWSVRGRLAEGYEWLRRLFDAAAGSEILVPPAVCAQAWNTLGYLAWGQGNYATAYEAHQQALVVFREIADQEGVEESLYYLGITRYRQDIYPDAQAFFDESLRIARSRNDTGGIARVLLNLGNIAYEEGRFDEADTFFLQSLDLEQSLGNRNRVANGLNNLGLTAMARKEYPKAQDLFERALAISRELADDFGVANFTMNLGGVARLRGEREVSWGHLMGGLKLAFDIGNRHILSHYLLQVGLLEFAAGKPAHCVFALSSARHVIEDLANSDEVSHPEEFKQVMAAACTTLGDARFSELMQAARSAPLGQIVALVLTWSHDGDDSVETAKIKN
ncbi:MAG: tetratricopeptide repeat protein [Armatimonadota bacterium]